MNTPLLLALDPGLDMTGFAVLSTAGIRPGMMLNHLKPLRLQSGALRTQSAVDLATRLASLAEQLRGLFTAYPGIRWLSVERPAYAGLYIRRREKDGVRTLEGIAEPMAMMHLATGTLVGTAASASRTVFFAPASGKPKLARHELVYTVWPELRGRKSNEDERDALYVGIMTLLDARRRWAA